MSECHCIRCKLSNQIPQTTSPFPFLRTFFLIFIWVVHLLLHHLKCHYHNFFFSLKSFFVPLGLIFKKNRKHSDFFKCGMCLNSLWGHCILYQSDDFSCLFVGWMEISKSKTYSLINWQLTDISLWETPFQYIIFIWLSFAGYSLHSHVIAPSSSTL